MFLILFHVFLFVVALYFGEKNIRIAVGYISAARKFQTLLPRTEAKAIYKSSSFPRAYFSSLLLVLTDKMAFTCRHVFILDRDSRDSQRAYTPYRRRGYTHVAADFSPSRPAFSIIHVKMSTLLCLGCAHFAFYSDSSARRAILHSPVERLIKPHLAFVFPRTVLPLPPRARS